LFHVSQNNPRRNLQLRYLQEIAKVEGVPDTVAIDRIPPAQLTLDEAMFLVRLRGTLIDEYFLPNVDASFAKMSHGVTLNVVRQGDIIGIDIARDMPAVRMVIEAYRLAREVFQGFVTDFVRAHLYERIRQFVPSSMQQGRDALLRRL